MSKGGLMSASCGKTKYKHASTLNAALLHEFEFQPMKLQLQFTLLPVKFGINVTAAIGTSV